ncbi:MAG TPA: copper homeostasis protein CutC [Verrucomicrobiales bacterium]|jgi:copper homeostasis protein|nr:copper homeostasis protein CutC [Verrucomicrobiales bacterium]
MLTIEICVDSLASVYACTEGGVDRIELCAGLVEGGTTPSAGFLKEARRIFPGRIMMMIRPRGGDFLYSPGEVDILCQDIRIAREGGADGVVFGCLTASGDIDQKITGRLVKEAADMDITFHRAFDVSRDPAASLESLISLGIPRVLTSGGRPSVPEGLDVIAALVRQSAGRITILPGGGIRAESVGGIVAATGVTECHLSARSPVESGMVHRRPDIPMGATAVPGEYEQKVADASLIRLAKAS